jgi:hypothetical protein
MISMGTAAQEPPSRDALARARRFAVRQAKKQASAGMQGTSMNPLDKFDISIRCKENGITAAVPQLGLYATASDIHSAVDALERKKAALLKDLTAAGEMANLSGVAAADPVTLAPSYGLTRFVLKVSIVFALVVIAIVITTNLIADKIDLVAAKIENTRLAWQTTLQDYTKIGGAQFWSKVEKGLDQLADPKSEMPEEKRQKILANIRAIRERWWPFIAEALAADPKPK